MKGLRLLGETCLTLALVGLLWGSAAAQLTYDVAKYKALADADSAETIPPVTKITLHNWQQYNKFMPAKTYAGGGVPSGSFPGWPVAGTNHWELRTDYVVD